jgi:hypothetical protein
MYLLAVTVSLALAISVATLVPIGSRKREGMLLWALGLFLYALTYLMYGLRGQVSNFFSIGVGNTALSAGLAMFTHALLVFQQRQWPPWRIWAPVAAVVVTLMVVDTDAVRRLSLGVILGLQAVALVVIVFQRLRVTVGRGKYLVIGGLLVALGIFVSRVVGVAMGADQSVSVDHSSLMQTVTHMLGLVVLIFLTVGFVIMTKERADALNVGPGDARRTHTALQPPRRVRGTWPTPGGRAAQRDATERVDAGRGQLQVAQRHLRPCRRRPCVARDRLDHPERIACARRGWTHGGRGVPGSAAHAKADEASRTAERLRQLIQDVDCLRRCNLKTTLSVSVGVGVSSFSVQ